MILCAFFLRTTSVMCWFSIDGNAPDWQRNRSPPLYRRGGMSSFLTLDVKILA
jgi:hypothetical protein